MFIESFGEVLKLNKIRILKRAISALVQIPQTVLHYEILCY